MVIAYFTTNWYTVSVPLNDTQDYDNRDFNLGQYYVFAKSTDIFETGITNIKDNNQIIKNLFADFDLRKFHQANSVDRGLSR